MDEVITGADAGGLADDPRLIGAFRPSFVHCDAFAAFTVDGARISVAPDSIAVIRADGARLLHFAGGVPGAEERLEPFGDRSAVTCGPRGDLYLAGGKRVWRWDPARDVLRALGEGPASVEAIAVSRGGRRVAVLWRERDGYGARAWALDLGGAEATAHARLVFNGSLSWFGFDASATSLALSTDVAAQSGSDFTEDADLPLGGFTPEAAPPAGATRGEPARLDSPRSATAIAGDGEVVVTSDGRLEGGDLHPWAKRTRAAAVGFSGRVAVRIDVDGTVETSAAGAPATLAVRYPRAVALDRGRAFVLSATRAHVEEAAAWGQARDGTSLPYECFAAAASADGAFVLGREQVMWWRPRSEPRAANAPVLQAIDPDPWRAASAGGGFGAAAGRHGSRSSTPRARSSPSPDSRAALGAAPSRSRRAARGWR